MKKTRLGLLSMSAALLTTVLAGCGTANNTSSPSAGASATTAPAGSKAPAASDSKTPVKLRAVVLPDDKETFELAYKQFQQKYPNIEVTFETYPVADFATKLTTMMSAGENIDVFTDYGYNWVDTGTVTALDDYIQKNKTDVSGYGPLINNVKIGGKIYEMPYRNSTWVTYYNKTLFDKAGVPYPKADMTWDEFRALAKKMTSGTGESKIYGAYIQQWAQSWYMPIIQKGHTLIDKDLTPFIEGLNFRKALEQDGSIMPWFEQVSTKAHYNAAFQKGNVAMNLIGDWHVQQLRNAEKDGKINFDWDIVPLPHPSGVSANTSMGTPTSLLITDRSKYKDEAYLLAQFMSGVEGAKVFASKGYLTGFINDEIKKIYIGDGTQKPKNIHYFLEQKVFPERPLLPGVLSAISPIFTQEGELALVGKETPEQAIKNIADRLNKEWTPKYGKYIK